MKISSIFLRSIFIFIFSHISPFSHSQCGQFSQSKTEKLTGVRFWDENNGFAFGGAALLTTHDGGGSWEQYDLPNFQRIFVEPLQDGVIIDENRAIVLGDDGIILKTDDKGVTWKRDLIIQNRNVNYQKVYFVNDSTGYLVGSYTESDDDTFFIYKTEDAGVTWELIESNLTNVGVNSNFSMRIADLFFLNESLGFLSGNLGDILYKTVDGGVTWTEVNQPTDGFYQTIHFLNSQTGYISTTDGVFKTNNGGDSWTPTGFTDGGDGFTFFNDYLYLNGSLGQGIRRANVDTHIEEFIPIELAGRFRDIYFVNESIGYAVGSNYYTTEDTSRFIIKTIDGGNTWSILDGLTTENASSTGYTNFLKKSGDNKFIYSFEIVESSGVTSHVFKSTDNGSSWQQIKKDVGVSGRTLYANENYISYIRNADPNNAANGVLYSESFDSGLTWIDTPVISNPPVLTPFQWQQVSENEIFALEGSVFYSNDKGQNWEAREYPPGFGAEKIRFLDSQIGFLGTYANDTEGLKIFKTENGGISWTEIMSFSVEEAYAGYTFDVKENTLVIYPRNAYASLFVYDIESSTIQTKPFEFYGNKLSVINSSSFIMIDNSNNMYVTYDGGDTWEYRFFIDSNHSIPEIYIEDEDNIFLWKYSSIEHLKNYYPPKPDLIKGETNTQVNRYEFYTVPLNWFTVTDWEVDSGGTITYENALETDIVVIWETPGEHKVRAKYVNECGESEFQELTVFVEGLNIPPDNYNIETISETCVDSNNGKVIITADLFNEYKAIIDEEEYDFTSSITIENLSPGTYQLCISIPPATYQQCYNINIAEAESILGRFNVAGDALNIVIDEGTPPFEVFVNDIKVKETEMTSFSVNAYHGDNVKVSSSLPCEGSLTKRIRFIDKLQLFPNPSKDKFNIGPFTDVNEVEVELFNTNMQLMVKDVHIVTDGFITLNLSDMAKGVYILKVDTSNILKLIKS